MVPVSLALPAPAAGRLVVPEVLSAEVDARRFGWGRREVVPAHVARLGFGTGYAAEPCGPTGLLVDVYG